MARILDTAPNFGPGYTSICPGMVHGTVHALGITFIITNSELRYYVLSQDVNRCILSQTLDRGPGFGLYTAAASS